MKLAVITDSTAALPTDLKQDEAILVLIFQLLLMARPILKGVI